MVAMAGRGAAGMVNYQKENLGECSGKLRPSILAASNVFLFGDEMNFQDMEK
jgi:hypothetical protein